jgi:hypothetical protein
MKIIYSLVGRLSFVSIMLLVVCSSAQAVSWPLRVSSQGNYLEDQNGVPFPIIGEAGWSAIVQLDQTELIAYLDNRRAKGFTAIIMNAIEHSFADNPPLNTFGQHPFTKGSLDWSVRNETYWANVDYVLNQAKLRGMAVLLFPAYIGYQCGSQGWCAEMQAQTNATMTNYGQWLGTRYANQGNIVWAHGGDANANLYSNMAPRVAALKNGIAANDPNHLHTAHSGPERSALDDYSSIVTLNTTYSYADPKGEVQNDYGRIGALPFSFIESRYENENGATIGDLQSQAMIAYLGGALLGHFFGNNPIWLFAAGWQNTLNSNGSVSMGNIGALMQSRAWFRLMPDYGNVVVTSFKGSGIRDYKATARTTDGETIMVWNPSTTPITVDMTKISGTNAKGWWWNPDNNSSTLIGIFPTTGTRTFTPSSTRRVLVLGDESKNQPAPGTTASTTDTIAPLAPSHLTIN